MPTTNHTVHNLEFRRKGSCNHCGLCGCVDCVHAVLSGDEYQCSIWETLEEVCETCSEKYGGKRKVTHKGCRDFPTHPCNWVCRKGVCGFVWSRADNSSMDTIPWLTEPYDTSGG